MNTFMMIMYGGILFLIASFSCAFLSWKIYQKNKQCFHYNLTSTDYWYDLGQISDLDDCSTFLKIYQQKRELNIGQLI